MSAGGKNAYILHCQHTNFAKCGDLRRMCICCMVIVKSRKSGWIVQKIEKTVIALSRRENTNDGNMPKWSG